MIDEKRLDEFAQVLKDFCRFPRKSGDPEALIDGEELLRLARLGLQWENGLKTGIATVSPEREKQHWATVSRLMALGVWAEKHAIPYLKNSAAHECYVMCSCDLEAKELLDNLPKEPA